MKFKYLLLGLLPISFGIGFTNAVTINCVNMDSCNPNQIELTTIPSLSDFTINNITSEDEDVPVDISFAESENDSYHFNLLCRKNIGCEFEFPEDETFTPGNYDIRPSTEDIEGSISFSYNGGNTGGENEGGNEGGNTGGGTDGGDSGSGDNIGLIGQLFPVVEGLKNTISEFIPYVVYIGLGLLSAIIGFFAIKWLINWVRGKSFGVFISRRRRK